MPNALKDKKILITAGPTREYYDPVRFLTNASSGEMGLVLGDVLARRGACVTVVCGPTSIKPSHRFTFRPVVSALDMFQAVKHVLPSVDVFIATAAVSDWRFEKIRREKEKKGNVRTMKLRLLANPDILFEAGRFKKRKRSGPLALIGFALETHNVRGAMKEKLAQKKLDLIIGNTPRSFASENIKPLWLESKEPLRVLPRMTKHKLSSLIADWLEEN